MNKALFIKKKMRGRFILWVIVMPMLAGCASLQTKGQGETTIPSTGVSEKIQKQRADRFSSNRLKSDAYYYFLIAEMKTAERQYKEAVEIYQKENVRWIHPLGNSHANVSRLRFFAN